MCELGETHMNTEPSKHKRYDEAFKRSAVEHWLLSGQSATQTMASQAASQAERQWAEGRERTAVSGSQGVAIAPWL